MLGLSVCDLRVTNFPARNIYIQILTDLGALEYGLKIGCSQLRECCFMRKKHGLCLSTKFMHLY